MRLTQEEKNILAEILKFGRIAYIEQMFSGLTEEEARRNWQKVAEVDFKITGAINKVLKHFAKQEII